jgi:isochorismate hydrolase
MDDNGGEEMTVQPLSVESAVLLLADHQTGVMDYVVKVPPRDEVEVNVARLVRAAVHLDVPLIFTTSEEDQNGTLLPALQPIAPHAYASRIERHGLIDALAEPTVAEALAATGRRQLITAGVGIEVCGIPPALHAHRDGYQVTFAADATGSLTALGHDIALRQMEHAGVTVATTATVIAELADNYPSYSRIMRG